MTDEQIIGLAEAAGFDCDAALVGKVPIHGLIGVKEYPIGDQVASLVRIMQARIDEGRKERDAAIAEQDRLRGLIDAHNSECLSMCERNNFNNHCRGFGNVGQSDMCRRCWRMAMVDLPTEAKP